jgi:hypothetical protein
MFLTKRRYTSTNKTCFELGNTLGPPPDPMMIEKFSLFCELGPFLDLTYWFNLQFSADIKTAFLCEFATTSLAYD